MTRVGGWFVPRMVLIVALLAISVAGPVLASGSFTFAKVFLKGEPAPGTETGTVFGPLSDVYLPTIPTIDADGKVSVTATLEGPAVTSSNSTGIWSWSPGTLSLVTRAGNQAPGVAPGGVFLGFPLSFALIPPAVGGGRLGFFGTLTGPGIDYPNDEGFWELGSQLQLVVREGAPAAGFSAGVFLGAPFGLEISPAGDAFFLSSLTGTGITTENNETFWSDRDGGLAVLVREGDPAPDTGPGITFGGAGEFVGTGYSFESSTWSNASKLAIQGNLTGPGVNTFNNEALFVERAGRLRLLAREGNPAPGAGGGNDFGGNSVLADFSDIAFNSLEQAAFTVRVGGANSLEYVLYSDHTGTLWPVAFPGDPAPGTNQHFGILTSQFLSDGGRIAFRASLMESGSWPPLGLWWDQPGEVGEISALVIPGQPVAGRPGVTFQSVHFIHAFNGLGQLVFSAELQDPVMGARTALMLAEPTGEIREVVVTGDFFDVEGTVGPATDMQQVGTIRFGALNETGQMAIRIDFTDGSFGFYSVSPPTTTSVGPLMSPGFRLAQNVPNPFIATTRFAFELPGAMRAKVSVVDASGRLVRSLLDEPRAAGLHSLVWDGRNHAGTPVSSGIYWARVEAGGASRSVRMVLLKR